jgi:hypothetical protein
MTTTDVGLSSFVSPFLLPYILADRQDSEERQSSDAVQSSPYDEKMAMYTPLSAEPRRQSVVQWQGMRTPSPKSSASEASSDPRLRSVIAQSVHELEFDPELTFLDSPAISSSAASTPRDIHVSRLNAVSPDRVPLDESEIGFSNELRASLEVPLAASLSQIIEEVEEPVQKRVRIVEEPEVLNVPKQQSTYIPKPPTPRRIKRSELKKEVPDTHPLYPSIAPPSRPNQSPVSRRAKEKALSVISDSSPPPKTEDTVQIGSPVDSKKRTRTKRVVESVPEPPKPRPVRKTVANPGKKRKAETTEESAPAPVEEIVPIRRSARAPKPLMQAEEPVVPSRRTVKLPPKKKQDFPLSACPSCGKEYKRKDLLAKHIEACKK